MKTKLLALFLTVAFAFSSYADTKVLSVATNGTEVITITETTTESGGYVIAGILYPYEKTVTTNVAVSTLPTKEHEINVEEIRKEQALQFKAQLEAEKERKERKEQKKKKAEALKNAYEFLSKPISKEK